MLEFLENRDIVAIPDGGHDTVQAYVTVLNKHPNYEMEIGPALSGTNWQID